MNNQQKTIEQLLENERDDIAVPSRAEFRSLLNRVTNQSKDRNTVQKGIKSPFGIFIRMTKNKLIIAGSMALLAIIIIIPSVKHRPSETPTISVANSTESPAVIMETAKGTITEDIISDLLQDIATEDSLIEQESVDETGANDSFSLDSALIS